MMIRYKPQLACLFLTICVKWSSAANILAVFPVPTNAEGYLPIMERLARRGHNVTVISPFPRKEPLANYTDVFLPVKFSDFLQTGKDIGMLDEKVHHISFLSNMKGMEEYCPIFERTIYKIPALKTFIREDSSHFDVVILETFYCQEPLVALSHKYSAHLIGVSTSDLSTLEAYYTGNTVPYSYVPHCKSSSSHFMSIVERVENLFVTGFELVINILFYAEREDEVMREHMIYPNSENLPHIDELLKNHSILLVDRHISLSYPRPYHENIVGYSGFTVKKAKPLPKDLEVFMSGAEHGVILFSLGSNVKSTELTPDVIAKFLKVFSKMKQRILMKWEKPELPGKPDNVRIAPWFPQTSILAHPNIVGFISNGGFRSLGEATYYGVPILGIPLYSDQFYNIRLAESFGYCMYLNVKLFTARQLMQSIQKLINDHAFKEAALNRSAIMKDRPSDPLETAVNGVEYVLRHNGARHLRPASLSLIALQYFYLDFFCVIFHFLAIVIFPFCLAICNLDRRQRVPLYRRKRKRD